MDGGMRSYLAMRSNVTFRYCAILGMAALAFSCAGPGKKISSAPDTAVPPIISPKPVPGQLYNETGISSWYGKDFHGRKTANGEVYDMYGLSAAHRKVGS